MKNGQSARPRTAVRRLLPRALLVSQVALTLILVAGAGLLAASLFRLESSGLGFDPKGVVTIPLNAAPQPLKGAALLQLYRRISDAVAHQPGIAGVSYTSKVPFDGDMVSSSYTRAAGEIVNIDEAWVSPAYFATMRLPLLAGRDFSWSDSLGSGLKIIVSQSAARLLLGTAGAGDGRAVGHLIDKKKEIIGVVADSKYNDLTELAPPQIFEPITQDTFPKPSYNPGRTLQRLAHPARSRYALHRGASLAADARAHPHPHEHRDRPLHRLRAHARLDLCLFCRTARCW